MTEHIQPYGEFRGVGEGCFVLDGEWYNTPFRRRMTVLKVDSGELVVHSPIRLEPKDYAKLDALGRVSTIVSPNDLHQSEAHFYKQQYPHAKLYVSAGAVKHFSKLCSIDGILPDAWPLKIYAEIECFQIQGTRWLHETVFFHKRSRTLVTTDSVFNLRGNFSAIEKFIFKRNKIYERFGPSRVFRFVFTSNKNAVCRSVEKILKWDFDKVIMSHGEVFLPGSVESAKRAFSQAFAEVGFSV